MYLQHLQCWYIYKHCTFTNIYNRRFYLKWMIYISSCSHAGSSDSSMTVKWNIENIKVNFYSQRRFADQDQVIPLWGIEYKALFNEERWSMAFVFITILYSTWFFSLVETEEKTISDKTCTGTAFIWESFPMFALITTKQPLKMVEILRGAN